MTACGMVVSVMLTGGNVADISVATDLLEGVFNCPVLEDAGYDSDAHRAFLRGGNNVPVIPGRKNRKVKIIYDEALYKLRNRIERYFGKLKENKRIDTRSDKHDSAFLAFIAIAAIKILLQLKIS